jgi:hypothetical protein
MSLIFAGILFLIVAGSFGMQFFLRLRAMRSAEIIASPRNVTGRYRAMLRLLDDDDLRLLSTNSALYKKARAERRKLFRSYLACLTKDYARLLAALRMVVVKSSIDRPDLVRALAKNRTLFALAVCRVEVKLALHAAGIGTVDVSGLVEAFEMMRKQVASMSAAMPLASAA